MILWLDGAHAPPENMRRDAALLAAAADPDFEPVLRLFGFAPAGITLGRTEEPARTLDLARCERDGVPWAVRPTGGRAVFHAEEWTYSFAAPLAHPDASGSVAGAWERLSAILVRSLERLGVPAALAPGGRATGVRPGRSPGCFATTARHEVVLEGRKLIGSAQRRTAHALLQQGSLLLGPGHVRLADYLAVPEVERARVREALRDSAAHAGGILGPAAPLERWAAALLEVLPPGTRRVAGGGGPGAAPAPGRPRVTGAFGRILEPSS